MKIELEVPDDLVDGKVLWLFAGSNHIGVKRPDDDWAIKDGHCSMCGRCCMASHIRKMGLPIKDGYCANLRDHPEEEGKKMCGFGANRPFLCSIGHPKFIPECTVTWRRANGE